MRHDREYVFSGSWDRRSLRENLVEFPGNDIYVSGMLESEWMKPKISPVEVLCYDPFS